ncbi:MAG TPA: OsmC family protein [Acidobacteriota bacterium]
MELKADIDWQQGLAFRASLDGFDFIIDGTPEAGGLNLGPRPKGLTLVSLAGCTGMDVISLLGKMKVKVEKFHVAATAQLAAEHPKKFRSILVTYAFSGTGIAPEPLRKAISLSEEKYCGVRASLLPGVAISHEIVLNGQKIPG